jgi:DNA repair ATPase RecN
MASDQIQRDFDEMRRSSDARLDRIEKKIDQLSDAMISLARAEEKLINIEKNSHSLYDRLNRHSEKIDALESKVDDNTVKLQLYGKIIFLLFGTALAAIASRIIESI